MFKSYIKIAVRNILKHRFYSMLNVLGLSTGLAAVLFIGLYISDELSFDRFHDDVDNLYRVVLHGRIGDQEVHTFATSAPIAHALRDEVPGVASSTRLWPRFNRPIRYEDKSLTIDRVFLADSNFFSFFSFPLLEGDPKAALKEPNSIVLTTSTAKQLFGNEPAVGKLVTMPGDDRAFTITGVAAEPPRNSQIQFVMLISFASSPMNTSTEWLGNTLFTYYRKYPDARVEEIDGRLEQLTVERAGKELQEFTGTNYETFVQNGGIYSYTSIPFADVHLFADNMEDDRVVHGNINNIYILGSIGLFILVIACINFMNLATARSAGRAKEVGLRKTMGSPRTVLVYQFLGESIVYAVVSVCIALLFVGLLMPAFNTLSGKLFAVSDLFTLPFLLGLLILVGFVGLLSGSYPAFYLTSFKIVEVFKGKVKSGSGNKHIRSTLVVFQFAVSIFLIISTVVVMQQLRYMQQLNIGIDRFNVMIFENLGQNSVGLQQALRQQSNVEAAGFSNTKFPGTSNVTIFKEYGKAEDHISAEMYADGNLIDVLKFELIEGRYFEPGSPADSSSMVINESALREYGWTLDDAIGKRITPVNDGGRGPFTVIGVVRDFNYENFRLKIKPLLIFNGTSGLLYVRYTGSPEQMIQIAQEEWRRLGVNDPLQYTFLDQNFDSEFHEEKRLSAIFNVFTILAIVVSCLGLFGLASFTAEQRTKEIGIRKTLGATVPQLSVTLSREFLILVGLAFFIAVVPAWLFLQNWLSGFEYHIALNILVFVVGGVIAALIASLTVGYQSMKAARTNPVQALRYE